MVNNGEETWLQGACLSPWQEYCPEIKTKDRKQGNKPTTVWESSALKMAEKVAYYFLYDVSFL